MATWSVSSTTSISILDPGLQPFGSGVQSIILDDKSGRFSASQRGFARAVPPALLAPMALGDMPFQTTLSTPPSVWSERKKWAVDVQNAHTTGVPLPLLTAAIDDTSRFIATEGLKFGDISLHLLRRRNAAYITGQTSSMFLPNVPASAFSVNSCDLLSEIQRHMLEPTIDGGLTWSPLWTSAEVQRFFNNRLSRFYLETGVIQEEFSVPVTAGTSQYNYPSDLVMAKRLTFEEELSVYNNLVSFWRLEEATGLRYDAIGPNNLTPLNTSTNATGKIGLAYANQNTASNNGVYIAGASQQGLNPGTGDFSLSLWVYPYSFQPYGSSQASTILSKGGNGAAPGSSGYAVAVYGSVGSAGILGVAFGDNASAFPYMQYHSNTALVVNTWQHIALVFNRATVLECYIDNVRIPYRNDGSSDVMSNFGPNTGPCTSVAPFGIGCLTQNQNPVNPTIGFGFDGRIDAVGYWSRALTRSEVTMLYNEGNGRELYPNQHDGPYDVLVRVDPFTMDNGAPGWQVDTGTPEALIEEPRSPLSFQLSPTPDVDGSVEGIYVADPADISSACSLLPIPNFMTWIIKYGVMADMLNKEGEANDPQRAQYCESRWSEGVQLTRLLLGFNDKEEVS